MRVAIIDDMAVWREEIEKALQRYLQENYAGETPVVEHFASGEAFLARFQPESYDLVFIDQYMAGTSGMDTARRIREQDRLAALVFVTSSREHAIESYGVRACGYLVKPFAYEAFAQMMTLAGVEKIRGARFIQLEQEKILLREILWCDRSGHYCQIHTDRRGILRFRLPAGQMSELFAAYPQFLACYKGCLVNAERVARLEEWAFVLDNGEQVPFAKRDRKKLEMQYHAYLFRREREDELL